MSENNNVKRDDKMEMRTAMAKKNPREFAYKVTTKTLAFENHFGVAAFDNGNYPLGIYDDFSRLSGVIIDEKPATFNIPKEALPAIIKKSDFAFKLAMQHLVSDTNENENSKSIAYTTRFTSGKLKGKSPAEVLLENPDNTELLNNHYKWLQNNLEKYPRNKQQMDAIKEASILLKSGNLTAESLKKSVVIPIYTPGFRPLFRRKREDGKSFVYDVKINFYVGEEYPVIIEAANFYAPVIQTDKGLLNVKYNERDTSAEIKNKVSLTLEMWEDIIYNIQMQMRAFEICNFNSAWKSAVYQDKENYENNRK